MDIESMFDNKKPIPAAMPKKKKRRGGPLHMIKVAMFMLRFRSNRKHNSKNDEVDSKSLWKRVASALRLLRYNQECQPLPIQNVASTPTVETTIDVLPSLEMPQVPDSASSVETTVNVVPSLEMPQAPDSALRVETKVDVLSSLETVEAPDSDSSLGCSDVMSQYASAQNLQELDDSEGCDDDDYVTGEVDEDGDLMIDARAEEFIANFYEHMRLEQHSNQ